MSELLVFIELGFRHITDLAALDHVLFLLVLAAIYRPRDWRSALWVISAFTVGHSITLALAVLRVVAFPTALIEFLIPVTIVATATLNIVVKERDRTPWSGTYRPLFAGAFGLIHGAGFANYLDAMSMDHIAGPLFGFNVGIELGQIVVLLMAGAVFTLVDAALGWLPWSGRPVKEPLRLRVVMVSGMVALVAARWAFERLPV